MGGCQGEQQHSRVGAGGAVHRAPGWGSLGLRSLPIWDVCYQRKCDSEPLPRARRGQRSLHSGPSLPVAVAVSPLLLESLGPDRPSGTIS